MRQPHCSHITLKRGSIYYYRRRLPRPHQSDVALSLHTKDYREAQYLAKVLDSVFDTTFKDETVVADIKAILREELRLALEADRQQHLNAASHRPVYVLSLAPHEDPIEADTTIVGHLLSEAREAIARRDLHSVQPQLDRLIETKGVAEDQRSALGLGLLQVTVQTLEQALVNLKGGMVDRIDLATTTPSGIDLQSSLAPVANSPLFSEVVPVYVKYGVDQKGWTKQTLNQNNTTYRMFIEVCGDQPVQQFQRRHFAQFFDLLSSLPSLWSKTPCWREMSLKEVASDVKGGAHKMMAMKTVSRHFAALSGLFDHLISRGEYEGVNPAQGFKFPDNRKKNTKRQMWEGAKLATLLGSPLWNGCFSKSSRSRAGDLVIKDAKYWLPLIGLYHGNRLEEGAQLRREDIQEEKGIWFLNISDDGDRQTKNESSNRRVPIHPRLKALGFLEYIYRVAPSPTSRIFPELVAGGADGKFGHSFSKWFTKYRKDTGVYEEGLDYHSFRHGVETNLIRVGVPDVQVDELLGHQGGGTGRQIYFKGHLPLDTLLKAISQLEWPEDVIEGTPYQ